MSAVVLWLPGCRQTGPATYVVKGKITYHGRPVPTGTVMFIPPSGPAAITTIATDGTYRTRTLAGKHAVAITAMQRHPPGSDPMSDPNFTPPPPLVPERFNRPSTSGLTAEVKPDSQNRIDFNLND